MSASADTYLRPSSPEVFRFRARVDRDTDRSLAADLGERARALSTTVELPESEREPYDRVADRVASYIVGDDWRRGRVARRCWATGECIMHASWVLFGSASGRGCECFSPECTQRRRSLEAKGGRS